MRRTRFFLAASGLLVIGALLSVSGCTAISDFYSDCKDGGKCKSHLLPSIDLTCTGTPTTTDPATMDLKVYNTECAVFAWAGATGSTPDGTMQNPFPTLQAAIEGAKGDEKSPGKWVIACNKDDFKENATTTNTAQIFGGFDCSTLARWTPDSAMKKTNLIGKDANLVALTLKNGGGVESINISVLVQDFSITAPSATAKGGSSVAVAVDNITAASFVQCDVKAGDGMDGEDGQAPPMGPATSGASAPMPDPATMNACLSKQTSVNGGAAGMTTCDDGVTEGGVGGKGGINAADSNGQSGVDGKPTDATQGKGGMGEGSTTPCVDGTKGKNGDPGGPGEPGPASNSRETLVLTGPDGGNGGNGLDGQQGHGGGGGGGGKSGLFCTANAEGNGASGGGGGAGGCGGKAAGGGKAGGSSIAIVSMGTGLKLTDVNLTIGKGGKGGAGAKGQNGGTPGVGSAGGAPSGNSPSKPGCKGGDGGAGGPGGPGGGGRGGHALGIAYASKPSAVPEIKTYTPGMLGAGGSVGAGGPMTSNGASGHLGACWDFLTNAACK